MNNLRCPSCDGPATLGSSGERLVLYTTVTFDQDGEMLAEQTRAGWCPPCQRDWEARAALNPGEKP